MRSLSRSSRLLGALLVVVTFLVGPFAAAPTAAQSTNPDLVISQIYGGGGNANAPLTNDYVELFNRSANPVSLNGLSVQYTSATGTGNFGANSGLLVTLPNVTLQAGQYFLVQLAGGANGVALPTANATGTINASATAGKFALVSGTASLGCNGGSTPCSSEQLARILDLVGFGTGSSGANFFEGAAAAPTLSNTTAGFRAANGCTDTNNNSADFSTGTPAPRNTSSPVNVCGSGPTPTAPSITTQPQSQTINLGQTATLSVVATGTEPLSYQWYAGASGDTSSPIGGATSSSFTTPALPGGSYNYWVQVTNSLGSANSATATIEVFDVCAAPYTPISAIQGSGAIAAITGNVSTLGVVVGDYEGPNDVGIGGFYLQDPAGDGNPATSDGIFVFTGTAAGTDTVSTGDLVRVTGFARERFNETTINGANNNNAAVPAANIVNCGTGSVAPTEVTLPVPDSTYLERYEGMLITLPQNLTISEYFDYDRFGEYVLALPIGAEGRPFTSTAIETPGSPEYFARLDLNLRSRILIDDGLGVQNPAGGNIHPNGMPFSLENSFRGGDIVSNFTGVLGFGFSNYRVQPTTYGDYTAANPRDVVPEDVGGRISVAAFNTLNYFLTLDYPSSSSLDNACGPLQTLECRGADSDQPDEFQRQRAKLLATLEGLDADVVGLIELENTTGVEPMADIVAGLGGDYAFIDTGTIGTDAIKVGIIYKAGTVNPVGDYAILDSSVDPRFDTSRNRPALAQTFEETSTGARFTVVVNHLKSKGSGCGAGDDDLTNGAGNCNGTRTAAAAALIDWIASDPTGSGSANYMIIGDLNSYAKEQPIVVLEQGGFTNLIAEFQGPLAYSYVFDGQFGYLDYAMASASLTSQVTGVTEWHINADEVDLIDYDTSFKSPAQDLLFAPDAFRSSDHDPVLVGLALEPLYRARQQGQRVLIERNVALAGLGDWDPDGDGWALVGRTNGAGDNGTLTGFFVEDGIPYAIVFNRSNNKGDRCIQLTPRSLDVVKKGQVRLHTNVNDNYTPCQAP